jgi:hypothetical protein
MGQDSIKIMSPTRRSKLHHVDNKFEKKEPTTPRKDGGMFSPREVSKNPLEGLKKRKESPTKGFPNASEPPNIVKVDDGKINIGENLRR